MIDPNTGTDVFFHGTVLLNLVELRVGTLQDRTIATKTKEINQLISYFSFTKYKEFI